MIPQLLSAGMSFLPAIMGLFGRQKSGVPDWLQPYLDEYTKNSVGGFDKLIADASGHDKTYKGLKQEALAAMGKGKYAEAGFGPIAQQVLNQLTQHQAAEGKAGDRQTSMGYAAAGINSGLLPAVLAQQRNEREQSNEMANASATSNVALNSVTAFQNEQRSRRDYLARLTEGKSNASGKILDVASRTGVTQPSFMQSLMSGLAGAAPGILGGLNSGGELPVGKINTGNVLDLMPKSSLIPAAVGQASTLQSNLPVPTPGVPQANLNPTALVPSNFSDWWKKYARK